MLYAPKDTYFIIKVRNLLNTIAIFEIIWMIAYVIMWFFNALDLFSFFEIFHIPNPIFILLYSSTESPHEANIFGFFDATFLICDLVAFGYKIKLLIDDFKHSTSASLWSDTTIATITVLWIFVFVIIDFIEIVNWRCLSTQIVKKSMHAYRKFKT